MTDQTTDRAALRDRIAAAIWERQNPGRRWVDCEYRWRADTEADADAVLAAFQQHLDIGDAEAWCKSCRRVWDGSCHRCESDAEQRLAKVRDLAARWQTSVRPGEPHPAAAALLKVLDEPAAVLPAPADRAAILREAADWYAQQGKVVLAAAQVAVDLRRRADAELRRLADEAQPTPCTCRRTVHDREHHNHTVPDCPWCAAPTEAQQGGVE